MIKNERDSIVKDQIIGHFFQHFSINGSFYILNLR